MDNIENIYSLSPLQQGLLFHSVSEPDSRVYQQQLSLRLDGDLDRDAFAEAWRQMMARHAVLRTAILWEDLDDAYQVVLNALPLPLTEQDWRNRSDQAEALRALEIAERERPLDLATPPLMRLCLVRLDECCWQLIWTHHHIVLDGWSEGIVMRDWLACYRALCRGQRPALPPARPFQDYIAWLAEQNDDEAAAYWHGRLGPITEPTPLPAFAPVSTGDERHHAEIPHAELPHAEQALVLSSEESRRLLDFARTQRVTPNTLIQAAWGWLLGSYAGQRQALFGITLGGRPDTLADAEERVGLFINTLPLRVEWETRELAIGDWLRRLQDEVAELRQYEYSALGRLKALSGITGDRALFEAILVFENFPLDESLQDEAAADFRFSASEGGIQRGDVRLTQGRNNFPLSLIAIPSGEAFEFALSYARDRFTDDQIRLMLHHFQALLHELTRDAQAPVATLQGLSAQEQQRLLAWGTGAPLEVPSLGLHQVFERQADAHPEREALVTRTGRLSYAELEAHANRLARYLQAQGVQPGQFVAIALERDADFVVALLAVLKAGAAYLPLDPTQPPARLADLLTDSGASLVISHSRWRQQLGQGPATPVELDTLTERLADASPARLDLQLPTDAAAYLIYTSGSTGTPKGVVIEHHAIVDYLHGLGATLPLPPTSRFGLVSTLAADLGHTQLFGALTSGGTLVLADEETAFDPPALATFLSASAVDVLKLTPSHLRGLLAASADPALLPEHTLILGGEALDADLVARVRALKPGLRIVNHYGPTETTVGTACRIVPESLAPTGSVALGAPLPNRRLYVLDDQGRPVPTGVPGELHIGGSGTARGYLNRPELTRERFVADPCAAGQHMYRSGDRVRWLADGTLEFLDRVDNQVKLRGYRIELGEVEAQVRGLAPQIRQVVARLVQLPQQPPRLVAYVVADSALSTDKLRDDLLLRVPDYLVPSAFILLDEIPLNANGKPDLRRLPLPDTGTGPDDAYVAPRNEVERQLAEIWQEVLGVEAVGIHDNFFRLGGDSILNLQIIARTGQLGYRLTPKQLFEHRTIAELAVALGVGASDAAASSPQAKVLPLSAGQQARLAAGPLTATWRLVALDGPLEPDTLARALQALQQHHRALQMALRPQSDGGWQQALPTPAKAPAVSRQPWPDDEAGLEALAERCLAALEPKHGETLHGCLLQRDGDTALLLVAHPLALDEAAWPRLLGDLELALSQLRLGHPPALPPTGGDWVAWTEHQQAHAGNEALDDAWEHWLQHADLAVSRLEVPEAAADRACHLPLEAPLSQALTRLCERHHLSWEALLATALASLLGEELPDDTLLLELQSGRPSLARLPLEAPIADADFDPARMVGALAHGAPMFLDWARDADPLAQLHRVAARIDAQPQYGADYAVLRHLCDNPYLQEPLAALPQPQVGLGWLGDWDDQRDERSPLRRVLAVSRSPFAAEALQVTAYRHRGRVHLDCRGPLAPLWAPRLQQRLAMLAKLAEAAPSAPRPEAFPLCAAQGQVLTELPLDWGNIDDLYPLSPTQEGMLLHTRLAPDSGIYLMQERFRWEGPLQDPALERAWQALFARHPILRTGFLWEQGDTPLQFVCRELDTAPHWFDWRGLDPATRERRLDDLLAEERRQGFDLARPPLMRLRVFRLGEQDYLLVRSFHHLLSDAWSFNLVLQDLLDHYRAECRQEPVARPLGRPFGDYIRWLRRREASAAEAFWKAELADFGEPTPLPIEHHARQGAPERVADIEHHLSVARTERLQALCRQHQLTPNTWLQGAWALLLSRYSGQDDVLFGITVSGRPAELQGVDGIAGVFINSLPLRIRVDDDQPVVPWLTRLFERNVALRDFEQSPLAEIQRWSGIEAGRALFDSLLIYENAPLEATGTSGVQDFSLDLLEDQGHTNYPLSLMVMPGSRLGLRLSYDSDRFARDAMERLLGHLGQLLDEMLEQPEAPLGRLNLLTPAERQRLLVDWNRSAADFPLDRTYAALFAERVAAHPQRIAAVCEDASLSYAELDRRANRIARALINAGAGPETLVALFAERGLPLLTMMIAVFKAGAACQPLDIHHPPRRLGDLLHHSGAPLVLASRDATAPLEALLAGLETPPACLIAEELWLSGSAEPPELRGGPEDLAYVVFTSGSTGTPKGAMVEQRGMLNNMLGNRLSLGLGENDRVAQVASPAFDISVWQFLAAPLVGASVHILPDEVTRDPAALLRAVEAQGITLMELVPTQIRGLLGAADADASLHSLRWLQSIGEALPPALVRDWLSRFPTVPLLNAYGPAECSDNIACQALTEVPANDQGAIPVGRPTANNRLYILDEARRPVPVGVPGEICAAGVGVGRGYWRDPERTAEAFVEHPFAPGERFYRTGDIGRWREDGCIEYLGRHDFQVKLRGQRVELGEIEAQLERQPGVAAAAVVTTSADDGSQHLVAYWSGPADLADAELRQALNARLPGHMVPSLFVRLEALPQNRNGKVDRQALAQRPIEFAPRMSRAPRSDTERQLAEIWAELLPAETFGIDDDFFALGGHSLLATQVLTRVRQRLAVQLPLKTLFEHHTIVALAEAVEGAREAGDDADAFEIPRVSRQAPLPLSYAQQRLWVLDQLEGANAAYNITEAVRLDGALDTGALQASVDLLLQRHESLRTDFQLDGEAPRQRIMDSCAADIARCDLSHLDADAQTRTVQRLIDDEAARPFDLSQAPMLRVGLLRLAEHSHILQFTLHHIAADAWSLGILVREFVDGYRAFTSGGKPALAPLAIQYADYAHWQRSEPRQRQLARDIDYWRQQLRDVPTLIKLPLDRERPEQPDYLGASFTHQLPVDQIRALQAYGQSHRATLFMVLLNAFNSVLQRATGEQDFVVGTDVANREHPALESLIGFFVNVLPLRARLKAEETFTARLERLRDTTLEAYQHQQVPFDKLVELVQPPRQPGVNPLVQVLFVMQNTPKAEAEADLPGLTIEELAPQQETSKFDLAVFVEENDEGGRLSVRWLYRAGLFQPETVKRLQEGFQSLLDEVARDADEALAHWSWQGRAAGADDNARRASRKKAKLGKLKSARPTRISEAPEDQVTTTTPGASTAQRPLPLVVTPRWAELEPERWAQQARPWIEAQLRHHGGLLFRGFHLPDAAAFERFAQAIEPSLYGQYGDLPKNTSGNNIYHSTPYPEQQMILFHNESSHMAQWPRKQWFYCETPAPRGGCTPIVDCREVYRRLPAEIIAPLERKGLLYVRHFTDKLDVPWQDFFKTEDRRQVEERCRQAGMRWEWFGTDGLRIEQSCPAVIAHPETGEKSFFNQVQLHHEACLEPEVRRNLHHLFGAERLPRNVYYGDGTPITDAVMEEIGRVYEACAVRFDWQKRDVVMLDNMLVAHARDPFEGERKICVAMGQMYRRQDLATPSPTSDSVAAVTQAD